MIPAPHDCRHRPWPAPATRPVMDMSWHDLLFMHWPVSADQLRGLLPERLSVDTFGGQAWLGVVPFRMSRVKPFKFPAVPGCSAFPELNVRTYVTVGGKPGVWFFSLDATNAFAVAVARRLFNLPYFRARMALTRTHDAVVYQSTRTHRGAPPATFDARYGPTGPQFHSTPGSLDAWLTERYCLYAADRKRRLWRTDIHHAQWPLQPAAVEVHANTMAGPTGIRLPDTAPLLHFARDLDVIAWAPQQV